MKIKSNLLFSTAVFFAFTSLASAKIDLLNGEKWQSGSLTIKGGQEISDFMKAEKTQERAWKKVGGVGTLHPDAPGATAQKMRRTARRILWTTGCVTGSFVLGTVVYYGVDSLRHYILTPAVQYGVDRMVEAVRQGVKTAKPCELHPSVLDHVSPSLKAAVIADATRTEINRLLNLSHEYYRAYEPWIVNPVASSVISSIGKGAQSFWSWAWGGKSASKEVNNSHEVILSSSAALPLL